ncbi:phosphate ABC transporter permease PstA [Methylophaga sp. OBS4]|uniref:phosphate ABC transporter permease PstA n=1 Tax=Methylophaga sp. OBS4 TaxID=2991935 RepID=UPI00224DCB7D|nr:phosphate ABC transporter permease PstA [Methylophaga sp. OBS4]MCX4186517.1 phosphate ABC transporter permease PstA [Methylophaga sp. OBS4]
MSERLFHGFIWLSALLVLVLLLWIIGGLLDKGLSHLSLSFLLEAPADSGRSGGIAPVLVATLLILGVTFVAALPLGLATAVWLAEFTRRNSRFAGYVRLFLDVLAGVPSIVFGLFGYAFFSLYLGMGFSIMSGGLTLACMILPVFIRTCEMGVRSVNDSWRQGASALGMQKIKAVWHVLLPAAAPAIVAGLILSMGRATAETAALIFTSGYVDRMPGSLLDSGRALSVHIYDLSMNVTGGDAAAQASALMLLLIIIFFNVSAYALTDRWMARRFPDANS